MFKKLLTLTIILLSAVIAVFFVPLNHISTIAIISNSGNEISFKVTLAETTEERERGLMYESELAEDAGMLFVFEEEDIRNFWMKNTLIPLDMVFFDTGFRIVHIIENATPCIRDPCDIYGSVKPAQYVLEIKAGQTKAKQIQTGNQAKLYR